MRELDGKVAFVTGGIGLAMAEPFGRQSVPAPVTART
jgi:NADP-dependent 3-hydroxy acid dehydrogenase YdfG